MKVRLFHYLSAGIILLSVCAVADSLDRIPPGDVAENFTLPDSRGKMHSLSDYRGKYVLITFWTLDCHHCKDDMASLEVLYSDLKPLGFEVIAIHAGDQVEAVRKMLKINPYSYPILFDLDLNMKAWGIPAIPTAYLITPDGKRAYRAIGTREWNSSELSGFLRNLLSKSSSL